MDKKAWITYKSILPQQRMKVSRNSNYKITIHVATGTHMYCILIADEIKSVSYFLQNLDYL